MNLSLSFWIGWYFSFTSANCFASCNVLLASSRSKTVPLLIRDWSLPSLLHRSGLVFTAAYKRLPTTARNDWRSFSVMFSVSCFFLETILWVLFPLHTGFGRHGFLHSPFERCANL